jgi:hypothetical protein
MPEIRIRGSKEFIFACTNTVLKEMVVAAYISGQPSPFTPDISRRDLSGVVHITKKGTIIMNDFGGA